MMEGRDLASPPPESPQAWAAAEAAAALAAQAAAAAETEAAAAQVSAAVDAVASASRRQVHRAFEHVPPAQE